MTDAMLGPLFTLVSIALPVGIACLAVGGDGRPSLHGSLCSFGSARTTARPLASGCTGRCDSTRQRPPIRTARCGWSRRSIREVDAVCRPGPAAGHSSVSRSGGSAAAPVGRSRRRANSGDRSRWPSLPPFRGPSSIERTRRWWMCLRSGSRSVVSHRRRRARAVVEPRRHPRRAPRAAPGWRVRGLASPRHAASARQGPAVRRRPGQGRDAPRLIPQPAVESRTGVGARSPGTRAGPVVLGDGRPRGSSTEPGRGPSLAVRRDRRGRLAPGVRLDDRGNGRRAVTPDAGVGPLISPTCGVSRAPRRSRGRSMRSGAGAWRRRSSPRSPACGRSGSTPAARSSCPRACSPAISCCSGGRDRARAPNSSPSPPTTCEPDAASPSSTRTATPSPASSMRCPRSRPTGSTSSSSPRRIIRERSTRSSSTAPIRSSWPPSSSTR